MYMLIVKDSKKNCYTTRFILCSAENSRMFVLHFRTHSCLLSHHSCFIGDDEEEGATKDDMTRLFTTHNVAITLCLI